MNTAPVPNDDLDIIKSELIANSDGLVAVISVKKLGTGLTPANGDTFELGFNIAGKAAYLSVARDPNLPNPPSPVPVTLFRALFSIAASTGPATYTLDPAGNRLIITAKRADVETKLGGPIEGAAIDTLVTDSYSGNAGLGYPYYDTSEAAATVKGVGGCTSSTVLGGGPTGSPAPSGSSSPSPTGTPAPTGSPSPSPTGTAPATPASKLANAGAVSSQYGDVASVAAKLPNASGAALVGKTVTFKLAGKTGSGKTNSAGVASAKLALASAASAQTLVASFAGDSSAKASSVSTKFTIALEKTKIMMVTAKSGTARTVTATLIEDDNRVLGSQKLVVYVNGAKKATLTTDAKGKVVYKAAKAGQTVKFAFAAVSGKWAASSVQQKLS